MYRYTGSTANNYVCIGILDKNECLNNRGAFMYRVIGVVKNTDSSMGTQVDMVKVIKENYTAFQVLGPHDSATYNMYWDSSWARSYVNSFPIYGGYDNLIADINWRHGTNVRHDWNAQTFFNVESGWGWLSTSKKALMYVSDYLFATGNASQVCTDNSGASTCASTWIYLGGGDGNKQHFEYTMDYSSNSVIGSYSAIIIRNWSIAGDKAGALWPEGTNEARRVRPVFYLKEGTYYNSGTGTYNDPFMVK